MLDHERNMKNGHCKHSDKRWVTKPVGGNLTTDIWNKCKNTRSGALLSEYYEKNDDGRQEERPD